VRLTGFIHEPDSHRYGLIGFDLESKFGWTFWNGDIANTCHIDAALAEVVFEEGGWLAILLFDGECPLPAGRKFRAAKKAPGFPLGEGINAIIGGGEVGAECGQQGEEEEFVHGVGGFSFRVRASGESGMESFLMKMRPFLFSNGSNCSGGILKQDAP
jgi:hypothetical protein